MSARSESPDTALVRPLGEADRESVVDVLTDAFAEYPVMRYVLGGDPVTESRAFRALIGFYTDVRLTSGWPVLGVEVANELVAAALLNPPGAAGFGDRFRDGLARLREALGSEAYARLERFETASEGHESDEPHFFLGMLGVRRSGQGRGYGRFLLDTVHRLADAAGVGVALSTEDRSNLRFYRDRGYTVVAATDLGDLCTYSMFCDARGPCPPS